MDNESFSISEVIAASPAQIYAAWLDSEAHSTFTGDDAQIEPFVGGKHSAFGGYAGGTVVELQAGRRIVQTWRSKDFPAEASDSRLEITFEETLGGTRVTILHTDVPAGQSDQYQEGWTKFYLQALQDYFRDQGEGTRSEAPHEREETTDTTDETTEETTARTAVSPSDDELDDDAVWRSDTRVTDSAAVVVIDEADDEDEETTTVARPRGAKPRPRAPTKARRPAKSRPRAKPRAAAGKPARVSGSGKRSARRRGGSAAAGRGRSAAKRKPARKAARATPRKAAARKATPRKATARKKPARAKKSTVRKATATRRAGKKPGRKRR